MTLGQAKQKTLRLLDEKTDKDYRGKFNLFFDTGQRKVATQAKPIIKTRIFLTQGQPLPLPEDVFQVRRIQTQNGAAQDFRFTGNDILLPAGSYLLEYSAYPQTIGEDTPDSYEFEIDADVQDALPYFVAAQCLIKENDQRPYYTYTDEYNAILVNARIRPEENTVQARYEVV